MDGAARASDAWSDAVMDAWLLMDRTIDWAALPAVAELVGADDMALLIDGLMQLRERARAVHGAR